jgi:DNA-binding transcriptional ArsR family regulator
MLKTILDDSPLLVETLGQVSRQNFSIIPHALVRDPKVTPLAKVVFLALDARIGQKHSQRVLEKTLAQDLNLSLRSLQRALKELRDAGFLTTYRTGRSNRYQLINPSRVKSVVSDTPNMAGLQINNSSINKQNSGDDVGEDNFEKIVLKVITAETKVYLQQNPKTKALCLKAQRLGENPHFYAKKVSRHFLAEKKKRLIRRDAGFIVSVCMKAILEGDETITQEVETPIPAKYDSNEVLDLCTIHADFGALKNACPLCRREKENKGLVNEPLKPIKPLQEEKFSQLTEGLFKVDK